MDRKSVASRMTKPITILIFFIPGDGCCWCGGMDWGYDVKVYGNYAFVGAWSGVHVFDLAVPYDPVLVAHYWSYSDVMDMAFHDGVIYLADGLGITVIILNKSTEIEEIERICLGEPVRAVGVNAVDRKLMVLTPFGLRRFEIGINPFRPYELNLLQFSECKHYNWMRVEGPWTYLAGDGKKAVYDNNQGTLVDTGPHHKLGAWVKGRVRYKDRAERIKYNRNRFEVWEEI